MDVRAEGWFARPALVSQPFILFFTFQPFLLKIYPVQSNGHDCGLWVLIWIAAVLRGKGTSGALVCEATMWKWRQYLATFINHL